MVPPFSRSFEATDQMNKESTRLSYSGHWHDKELSRITLLVRSSDIIKEELMPIRSSSKSEMAGKQEGTQPALAAEAVVGKTILVTGADAGIFE